MQITIDTNNLSELDINMLAFLAGQEPEAETEPDEPVEETPAPAKKAPAKKAAAAKPAPEPEVPSSEEAGDGGDEDLVGGTAPTMSDAVAAATKLVSSGGSAKVKAALEAVGAKRVSEMAESDIPAFLAALED